MPSLNKRIRLSTFGAIGVLVALGWAEVPPEMKDANGRGVMPVALQVALKNAWRSQQRTFELPAAEVPMPVTITVPAFAAVEGRFPVMRFRTRMVTKGFGGWNNFLEIRVNGKVLNYNTEEGTQRILNRGGRFMATSDPKYPLEAYFRSLLGHKSLLLVPFSHTWDELEPRFLTDRKELYWYLLDISDVAKPGAPIAISFLNVATPRLFKKPAAEMKKQPLLVDSLEVGLVADSVRDRLTENIAAGIARFNPSVSVRRGGIAASASQGGAIRLQFGGDAYYLRSRWSEPASRIRFNRFWWTPTPDWKVTSERSGDDELQVTGKAEAYTLVRTLRLDPPFVRIRDEIQNRSGDDLGVRLNHDLIAAKRAEGWHVAGLSGVSVESICAYNPTVHLAGEKTGLGAAVKDSRLRARLVLCGQRRLVTLQNDHYGVPAGKTAAMDWAVYCGGPDYWEFINAVRRDWRVNHLVPGMWGFCYPYRDPEKSLQSDPEALHAFLRRKHMKIFAVSPWFEYYFKPEYWRPRSVYKANVMKTMSALKAVEPKAKVVACLESFLYYRPESFFKGTLPKFWTDKRGNVPRNQGAGHNVPLSEAGTKIVDATPWADSVFRTRNGRVEIDLYYAQRYKDGGVNLKVFPTLTNHWHKVFMGMLDYCINECGLDGVYIDSFSYYSNRTYDRWDGCTVDLDPVTGRIQRKYASLGLLTRAARREWVKYVTDRGKIVVTNGKPATAELQDTPQLSFMEAEWSFEPFVEPLSAPRAAQAQLSTPLALGVRPTRWPQACKTRYAEIVQRAVIAYLRHGALYCHYVTDIPEPGKPGGGGYGVTNHMFPFTPVELHEGWVVGKERIVTCVSGTYAWPHEQRPSCLRFDLRGMPVADGFTLKRRATGWRVVVSLKDWRETAVIEQPGENE